MSRSPLIPNPRLTTEPISTSVGPSDPITAASCWPTSGPKQPWVSCPGWLGVPSGRLLGSAQPSLAGARGGDVLHVGKWSAPGEHACIARVGQVARRLALSINGAVDHHCRESWVLRNGIG